MSKIPQRIFVSDCEGPISKNDNAFELAAHFIPKGDSFFALISKYDDVLADIVKRPGYRAGHTLKLILPFLKAHSATNHSMTEYSSQNVILVSGARRMLQFVKAVMPSFIVSTSYEQYMRALCSLIEFSYENVYCTRLDLDKYKLKEKEKERLGELREEISGLPMLEVPKNATSLHDFSTQHQKTIRKLDEIFWKEIAEMDIGKIFSDVKPVGGYQKAEAVQSVTRRLGKMLSDVMYVGDSITDVSAFQLVRRNGGLTVSFNGNQYAVKEAEIAVLSESAVVTAVLADTFNNFGRNGVLKLVKEWNRQTFKRCSVDPSLREYLLKLYSEQLPQVEIITPDNEERLMKESSAFRKAFRGEIVGKLG